MKKKLWPALIAISCVGVMLMACSPTTSSSSTSLDTSTSETSESSSTSEEITTTKWLEIDISQVKTKFTTNETFTSQGLIVKLFTSYSNSTQINEEITNDYQLFLNGQTLNEGDSLTRGEKEIVVAYTLDNSTRSATYQIVVEQAVVQKTLYEVVNELVTTGNYSVKSYYVLSQTDYAEQNGIITKDGVYWSEPTDKYDDYDFTDGFGYSSYNGRTFQFKLENNKVVPTGFLDSMSSRSADLGLWDKNSRDYYGYNIPNYSINNITDEELNYLKDLQPTQGSIYNIDVKYSSWLFSLIGHKNAYYNPQASFQSGTIRVTVTSSGNLDVYTESSISLLAAYPMTSTINKIGTTEFEALENFLANPDFGDLDVGNPLLILKNNIDKGNYLVKDSLGNLSYYTSNYIFGEYLSQFENKDLLINCIELKDGNTLGVESGTYHLLNDNNTLKVETNPVLIRYELSCFRLFNSIDTYFQKIDNTQTYVYELTESEMSGYDASGTLDFIVPWFIDKDIETTVIKTIELVVDSVSNEYTFAAYDAENILLGRFSISNFGNTKNDDAERLYQSINNI